MLGLVAGGALAGERALALHLTTLAVLDVDTRADEAGEDAVGVVAGHAAIEAPSVFPVGAAQAVLHLERAAGIEGRRVDLLAAGGVIGMHALDPAAAELLLRRTAGEL